MADDTLSIDDQLRGIAERTAGWTIAARHRHTVTGHILQAVTDTYKMGERKGRSDCLQEILDLKKPLLRLIERLLDYASAGFCNNEIEDTFELSDTKRYADLKADIIKWNDDPPGKWANFEVEGQDLMSYMAHRVREALAEEEG